MNDGHLRRSIRMPYGDYGQTAPYFITICTDNHKHTLGKISNGQFIASQAGKIVDELWHQIPQHFSYVTIDRFCVMPNHMHGVIHIAGGAVDPGGARHVVPLPEERDRLGGRKFGKMQQGSLSVVLHAFKAAVSTRCRMEDIPFRWQKNFHDNIIRTDKEYHTICRYIENNVMDWEKDKFHT